MTGLCFRMMSCGIHLDGASVDGRLALRTIRRQICADLEWDLTCTLWRSMMFTMWRLRRGFRTASVEVIVVSIPDKICDPDVLEGAYRLRSPPIIVRLAMVRFLISCRYVVVDCLRQSYLYRVVKVELQI